MTSRRGRASCWAEPRRVIPASHRPPTLRTDCGFSSRRSWRARDTFDTVTTGRKYHASLHMANARYALEVLEDERTGKRTITVSKDGEVVVIVPAD